MNPTRSELLRAAAVCVLAAAALAWIWYNLLSS